MYQSFSCGAKHSCFVSAVDGLLYTWGLNEYHQTGRKLKAERPTPLVDLPPVLAIGLGEDHMLVTTSHGVFCFGDNGVGQCGAGEKRKKAINLDDPLIFPGKAVSLVGSSYHSLALLDNGDVYRWGRVGGGKTPIPTRLDGVHSIVQIGCGYTTVLCLRNDGRVYIDDGQTDFTLLPYEDIIQVVVGAHHGLVIAKNGNCYGVGMLHLNEDKLLNTNIRLGAAGYNHSCLLTYSNTLIYYGQRDALTAQDIPIKFHCTTIVCFAFHCYALADDGTVYHWRDNKHNQRGDADSSYPEYVPSICPRLTELRATWPSTIYQNWRTLVGLHWPTLLLPIIGLRDAGSAFSLIPDDIVLRVLLPKLVFDLPYWK